VAVFWNTVYLFIYLLTFSTKARYYTLPVFTTREHGCLTSHPVLTGRVDGP